MKTTAKPPRRSKPPTDEKAIVTGNLAVSEQIRKRQLEKSVSWTGRERLRYLWYQLRLAVQEMNYASRRMVELQMRLP